MPPLVEPELEAEVEPLLDDVDPLLDELVLPLLEDELDEEIPHCVAQLPERQLTRELS